MQLKNAAALIYTRTKYAGFRQGFIVQPKGLPMKLAESLVEYAHDAMDGIAELRSQHKYSRIIIAEGDYVMLGVAAYLRDLAQDDWSGQDRGNRPVQGFFSYVFRKDSFTIPIQFPELKAFTPLMEEWIRPHWEDSENSSWAQTLQISEFSYSITTDQMGDGEGYLPPTFQNRVVIEKAEKEDQLVNWAVKEAVAGHNVSVCTNICVYYADDLKTKFRYIAELKQVKTYHTSQPAGIAAELANREPEEKKQASFKETPKAVATDPSSSQGEQAKSTGDQKPFWTLLVIGIVTAVLASGLCLKLLGLPFAIGVFAITVVIFVLLSVSARKKKMETEHTDMAGALGTTGVRELNLDRRQEEIPEIKKRQPVRKETTDDLFKL